MRSGLASAVVGLVLSAGAARAQDVMFGTLAADTAQGVNPRRLALTDQGFTRRG